jgi:short-subunit dehydrogenase
MEYRGRTALVTGASSGIGARFAEALAGRGADLVLVARSADVLERSAARLAAAHGVRVVAIPADLTVPGAGAEVVARATELAPGATVNIATVNILVNNAGLGSAGRLHEVAAERSRREVALDVAAVVDLTRACLPHMVARGTGAIVNVASIAAFQPAPYMAVYAASKAFVLSFSQALTAEYRPLGVHVLAVNPGPVRTRFTEVVGTRQVMVGRAWEPRAVVDAALRALDRNRSTVTPGRRNAAVPYLARLLPRPVTLAIAERMLRRAQEAMVTAPPAARSA